MVLFAYTNKLVLKIDAVIVVYAGLMIYKMRFHFHEVPAAAVLGELHKEIL